LPAQTGSRGSIPASRWGRTSGANYESACPNACRTTAEQCKGNDSAGAKAHSRRKPRPEWLALQPGAHQGYVVGTVRRRSGRWRAGMSRPPESVARPSMARRRNGAPFIARLPSPLILRAGTRISVILPAGISRSKLTSSSRACAIDNNEAPSNAFKTADRVKQSAVFDHDDVGRRAHGFEPAFRKAVSFAAS